ncbi:diguanylate cyclase [Shimia abyssi]|uniref:diguanylate cyclase n=1 Tax=Shimia abyssi TaxID=1662395 RepID=A0A2P8FD59_9RHOB|nr:diguanylate cyclase [Shimia abyssi]PSL19655.1 response regulator receiver modulated diguanylate cyclase [Shimia abyssi]
MPGRILIIDSIATNRIVLKVKLASAFYRVEQAANANDALSLIQQSPPDLVILGDSLPDMAALSLCRRLKLHAKTRFIPIILVSENATCGIRRLALEAGADDVLAKPHNDTFLKARIRSLLRARDTIEELRLKDSSAQALGFAESPSPFDTPAAVLLATHAPELGLRWRSLLKPLAPYAYRHHPLNDALRNLSQTTAPDAFVIALDENAPEEALRFLAEIRARSATRKSAVLIVMGPNNDTARVDALDLGADDVLPYGFDAEEVTLRLDALIRRKHLIDRLRQNVHDGLNAAVTDPLTGLHNRRYALPQLARIARQSGLQGTSFAVMVADLDHFKGVNDRYGHAAGDVVLAEIARRMRQTVGEADLLARLGGEEFLIVLRRANRAQACDVARRLCEAVRAEPVYLQKRDIQIPLTVSIGVAMGDVNVPDCTNTNDINATDLIDRADKALYGAKSHGRDQVTLSAPAA